MSTLVNLNSQLNSLQTQKSSLAHKLNIYKKRKIEIERLIKNLTNIVDCDYENINKYEDKMGDNICNAFTGSGGPSYIGRIIFIDKEKSSSEDGNISGALSCLRTEIQSIDREIDCINSDLRRIDFKINDTKSEISTEKTKLAKEAAEAAARKAEEARKAMEEQMKRAFS